MTVLEVADFFGSVLRLSMPVLFACLGGFLSERSGVVHLGLEGKILFGAFTAATFAHFFGNPWLATLASCFVVGSIGLGYGVVVVKFKANQVIAGTALNLLAFGLLPFATKALFQTTNNTPNLELHNRLGNEIFGVLFVVVFAVILVSRRTVAGVWHRTAGEAPQVLASLGIDTQKVRLVSLIIAGVLCGLAGSSLSLYLSSGFVKNMSAGRGFMALAAVILGRWNPVGAVCACLFFGLADAVQIRLQGVTWFLGWTPPLQLIQCLPYLMTLVMISGFVGRSRAPAALGRV